MWDILEKGSVLESHILFFYSVVVTIVGIANWSQRYQYSKNIILSILLVLILFTWVAVASVQFGYWTQKLEDVHDLTFANQDVPLDGHAYSHCTFTNVTFIINGKPGVFKNNSFNGKNLFTTTNEDTLRVLQRLSAFGVIPTDKTGKFILSNPKLKGL